jgi:uncharacterized protein (DUF433 family)
VSRCRSPDEPVIKSKAFMSKEAAPQHPFGDRIIRDRQICGGEPVFAGTRILLRTVLASLAAGDSIEDILADFATLKTEDVWAAIAFAAASAEEDLPVPTIPNVQ